MSSGSGAPHGPVPASRDPNQADGGSHAKKGDNHDEGQPELQRSSSSSGNQTTANQQQSSTLEGGGQPTGFTYGKSDQRDVDNRRGGAEGGGVAAAMLSPEETPKPPPRTRSKKIACRDFQNIDYSGHFKVNLISKDTGFTNRPKVLKMKTEEEQFIKFCHLFYCDLQLSVVKDALQSEMDLAVIQPGYPPSIRTQPAASDPENKSVEIVLKNLCYQLSAVNISSTPWNINQVRTILSSLDSYQKGIVIGYEVSGDSLNYWLAGERGSMESTIEVLSQKLGQRNSDMNQQPKESKEMDMVHGNHDGDVTDSVQRKKMTLVALEDTHTQNRGDKHLEAPSSVGDGSPGQSGSDNVPQGQSGSDNIPQGQSGSDNIPQGQSGSDNIPQGQSGSDNVPRGRSGSDRTPPSRSSGSVYSDADNTSLSIEDRQAGGDKPHILAVNPNDGRTIRLKETANFDTRQFVRSTEVADGDKETQKGYHELTERSGKNANNPPQKSTSAPVDQSIDRQQSQGSTISSPSTGDQHGPLGQNLPVKHSESATSTITTTTTLTFDGIEKAILLSIPIFDDFSHKFKNLRFTSILGHSLVLDIFGDEVTVHRVATEIQNQLKEIERTKVDLANHGLKLEMIKLLRVSSVSDYIKANIRSQQLACYLEQKEDTTMVYATVADMDRALHLIKSVMVCREIELGSDRKLFLDSQDVQQEMSDLQKEYNGKLAITTQESLVTLSCTADIEDEVLTTVNRMKKDFSTEVKKTVEYTSGGDLTVELCTKILQHDIQKLEDEFSVKCIVVKNNMKQGWQVKGPNGTLEKACVSLSKIAGKVTSRDLSLDKVSMDIIQTMQGQELMVKVSKETGCFVYEQKKAGTDETERREIRTSEKSNMLSQMVGKCWQLPDGRKASLLCGNWTTTSSDMLVVELGTTAISHAAAATCNISFTEGEGLKREAKVFIPDWSDGARKEKEAVRQNFDELFKEVAKSFPDITSVTVLLDTATGWARPYIKHVMKNIHCSYLSVQKEHQNVKMCNYHCSDRDTYNGLCSEFERYFQTSPETLTVEPAKEAEETDFEMISSKELKSVFDQELQMQEKNSVQVGHLTDMAQKDQCIVNTTHSSLDLKKGAVSTSILKAAGQGIQSECWQYHANGVQHGEVVVTHGYDLKCKYVLHGALPDYWSDTKLEKMKLFIRNCLAIAKQRHINKIAFPALGTGNLKYPADLVAKTMFSTVREYLLANSDCRIEAVTFVIFPADKCTIKAFKDEQKKQKELCSQKAEKLMRAMQSGRALKMNVGSVDVWLTEGDVQSSAGDGLVIFWDQSEIYKQGKSIGKSYYNETISPAGINQLTSERTESLQRGQPVWTSPGSLNFKQVLHLRYFEKDMTATMMGALNCMDKNRPNYKTLTLALTKKEPLWKLSDEVVDGLVNALEELSMKNLKRVEIVVDDSVKYKQMMSKFKSLSPVKVIKDDYEDDVPSYIGSQTKGGTRNQKQCVVIIGESKECVGRAADLLVMQIEELKKHAKPTLKGQDVPDKAGNTKEITEDLPVAQPTAENKDHIESGQSQSSKESSDRAILQSTDEDKTRLILEVTKWPCTIEDISAFLNTKSNTRPARIMFPFCKRDEALLIFQSPEDAENVWTKLQPKTHPFKIRRFPIQTVSRLKAYLKPVIVTELQLETSIMSDFHGIELCKEGTKFCLQGSLLEIQEAYKIIRQILGKKRDTEQKYIPKQHDQMSGGEHFHKTNDISMNSTDNDMSTMEKQGARPKNPNKGSHPADPHSDRNTKVPERVSCTKYEYEAFQHFFPDEKVVVHWQDDSHTGTIVYGHDVYNKALKELRKDFTEEKISDLSDIELERYNKLQLSADYIVLVSLVSSPESFIRIQGRNADQVHLVKGDLLKAIGRRVDRTQKSYQDDDTTPSHTAEVEMAYINRFDNSSPGGQITNPNQTGHSNPDGQLTYPYQTGQYPNQTGHSSPSGQLTYPNQTGHSSPAGQSTGKLTPGVHFGNSKTESRQLKEPPKKSYRTQINGGMNVHVYEGDILSLKVDAIVIATNEDMDNKSELWKSLKQEAGQDWKDACIQLLANGSKLCFGKAYSTTAGALTHYKRIIHVVSPSFGNYQCSDKRSLVSEDMCTTITCCLKEAENTGMTSIAFPCIGSGIGKIPIELCASAFCQALNTFNPAEGSTLRCIHVVDLKKNKVDAVCKEFKTGPSSKSSKAVSTQMNTNPTGTHKYICSKLSVQVFTADISTVATDAIVSIEDEDFSGKNPIAKAIRRRGGKHFEEEMRKKVKTSKPQVGDVIRTKGIKFTKANHVLHAIMPVEEHSIAPVLKKEYFPALKETIHGILRTAEDLNVISIAMPMFGSGLYGAGDREKHACLLRDVIIQHGTHQKSGSCLAEIFIVNKDEKTTRLMEDTFKKSASPSIPRTRQHKSKSTFV